MPFAPLVVTVALIYKITDGIKMVVPKMPPWAVQALSWVVGVAGVMLLAKTNFAPSVGVGSFQLDHLNAYSQILFGLSLGSTAGLVKDSVKAVDNTRTTALPGDTVYVPPTPPASS